MNKILKLMASHASVRRFKNEAVPDDLLNSILNSARQASTSSNVQAYSIIVIKDQDKKVKLAEFCGNQLWVEKCPVFLVICPDLKRLEQSPDGRAMNFRIVISRCLSWPLSMRH